MGGILKPLEKPFRSGASAQQRRAEAQARLQEQQMREQQERFKKEQAAQEKRNAEMKAQQEATRNQSELQSKIAGDAAANAGDDTPEIQIGADLTEGVGARKRKRRATGATALGL